MTESQTTSIGFITYDTVSACRELDPIAWDCAREEYIASLESGEEIISFDNGSTFYWKQDVEELFERR